MDELRAVRDSARPGPWVAGLDFPFGQARCFIETIGWPGRWGGYVDRVAAMTRTEFRRTLDEYRQGRAYGDREHRRIVDVAAGSISPQKLYGIPVALMFHEGAPRLRQAGVTIPVLQSGDPERIVVEAYPGVLARWCIGRRNYKHDTQSKQTENQRKARQAIVASLSGDRFQRRYGLQVEDDANAVEDPGGDRLDALLCAIQAAWALQSGALESVAMDADRLEGWIADPQACGFSIPSRADDARTGAKVHGDSPERSCGGSRETS